MVLTFFPLYGLAIGLTLTQIGLFQGIHGAAASAVRFLSGAVFRFFSYDRVLPLMVALSGLSVAVIAGVKGLAILGVAWAVLGLTRGLLRVAAAAVVMDEAGETDRDAARHPGSISPGSTSARSALAAAVRLRQGHLHSGDGRGAPNQQAA